MSPHATRGDFEAFQPPLQLRRLLLSPPQRGAARPPRLRGVRRRHLRRQRSTTSRSIRRRSTATTPAASSPSPGWECARGSRAGSISGSPTARPSTATSSWSRRSCNTPSSTAACWSRPSRCGSPAPAPSSPTAYDLNQYGADVLLSKGFTMLTPYIGVGFISSRGRLDRGLLGTFDDTDTHAVAFAGRHPQPAAAQDQLRGGEGRGRAGRRCGSASGSEALRF